MLRSRRHSLRGMLAAPAPLVLGVDPGGRHTGAVVRHGQQLLAHTVLEVAADREPLTRSHVLAVARQCSDLLWGVMEAGSWPSVLVAVEGLVDPNPHLGVINLRHLLGTATVLGGLLAWSWPMATRVVTVRPGNNGSGLLAAYPPALVTDGERRKGLARKAGDSALIRHARSAWDVAGQAPVYARLAA